MVVDIFLDTNAMPRDLKHYGHGIVQLIELVKAELINVHASTVTIGEWRSQMLEIARQGMRELHQGLRKLMHHEHLHRLRQFQSLANISRVQESMSQEVDKLTNRECDALLKLMGVNEIPFGEADSRDVFAKYFSGGPPFAHARSRPDIPDAFIHCAAKSLRAKSTCNEVLAVSKDSRLAGALSEVKRLKVVSDLNALFKSNSIQEAMKQLELFKAWTPLKKTRTLKYLRSNDSFATQVFQNFADIDLPGTEVVDPSIPVDNNVATIDSIYTMTSVVIDWSQVGQIAPGWIFAPFAFECEAGLSVFVFRADAYSMPDWINVSMGDFEHDYYFDGSAYRMLRVTGSLSMRFSLKDLEGDKVGPPSLAEVEDVEIELLPLIGEATL